MNEFNIAREFGASAYVIYNYVKLNPKATKLDVEIETGLSDNCVTQQLQTLIEVKLLNRQRDFLKRNRAYIYTIQ